MKRYEDPNFAYVKPFDKHVAESDWPTCNCQTCQEVRKTMDSLPGPKIDWKRYRERHPIR